MELVWKGFVYYSWSSPAFDVINVKEPDAIMGQQQWH